MTYREILVIDTTRGPRMQKHVEQRISAGLCLFRNADGTYCDSPHTDRGRCNPHFQRFNNRLKKCRTRADRQRFEAAAIKAGLILASYEICELKQNDPESQLLAEFT